MPVTEAFLRPLARLPMPAIRRWLSVPIAAVMPSSRDVQTLGTTYGGPSDAPRLPMRHLTGSVEVNPTGAILWQGRVIRHPAALDEAPDLLVHYASRRRRIEKAILLDYAHTTDRTLETRVQPRIARLRDAGLTDRVVLVGVAVARQPAFQRAMASGAFLPLEFEIHREDTRIDCDDLLLPLWPDDQPH